MGTIDQLNNKEIVSIQDEYKQFEDAYNTLQNKVKLSILGQSIETENPKPGEFKFYKETKNGYYSQYKYKIQQGGTPNAIRDQAVKKGLVTTTEGIQIINGDKVPYAEGKKIAKDTIVYVNIPIPGKFINPHKSKDQKFMVYGYVIEKGGTPGAVKDRAIDNNLSTQKDKDKIEITNGKGEKYDPKKQFSKGNFVYVRIPIPHEGEKKMEVMTEESKRHWNNESFFQSPQEVKEDKSSEGITLRRDVGMSFYVMTTADLQPQNNPTRIGTINHLRTKLAKLPEFSYLTRPEYEPKKSTVNGNTVYDFTQTFNIRNDFAEQTRNNPNQYFIPIPLDSNIRKIDDATFQNYAEQGIDKIRAENSPYKGDRNRENLNKKNLSKFFTAIAKIETGKTTSLIGTDEYHRWEDRQYDCFSFGPYHILKDPDDLSCPGTIAYNNLVKANFFSTEGQTYHPVNATMWCMGFIAEKCKKKDIEIKTLLSFINKKTITVEDVKEFVKFYNGENYKANNYHNKLVKVRNSL